MSSNDEPRKSLFQWLCGVLFCYSCSRSASSGERRRASSAGCSVRYCLQSPVTASLFFDTLFLLSLIWALYDASLIMRMRDFAYWWTVPAAIAAPTFLVVMLKLRYLRRLCDSYWEKDIVWNARIVLLPMLGALTNTFLFSGWVLCSPFYIIERATAYNSGLPLSLEDYTNVVRAQAFNLFTRASSLAFLVSFVCSVIVATYLSARHRRVLLRFIAHAVEEGLDVTGNGRDDTSLLTRDEMDEKNMYDKTRRAARAVAPKVYDTSSLDSLYNSEQFVHERATFVQVQPAPIGEMATMATTEGAGTIGDSEPIVTPRAPGVKSYDTVSKHIAYEAISRRAETMSRYDSARGTAQQPPPPKLNPPPPIYSPPAAASGSGQQSNGGADDESETRMDSPRTIEFIKRQRQSSRGRTDKDK